MVNLYSVTYNTNNSTAGTTPPSQTANSDSTTYSFTAPTAEQYGLAKTGYTFMGWAESPTAPIQEYNAGASIALSDGNPTKTLYAVWGKNYTYKYSVGEGGGSVPANGTIMLGSLPYTMTPTGSYANVFRVGHLATGWNSVTFTAENPSPTTTPTWTTSNSSNFNVMQEIGTTGYCAALDSTGRQLGDIRDGKKYWVARLADGNCWMTQNLAFEPTKQMTSSDSDVTSNTTLTKSTGWSNGSTNDGAKNINWQISTTGSGHGAYGGYYTWQAATANTAPTATGEASGSICPKGWRLPLSNSTTADKSFGKLTTSYSIANNAAGATALQASPLYFIMSGYVNNGSLGSAGSEGRYWSSTASSASEAYRLYFTSSNVYPSTSNSRYSGFSVRCVAR